MLRFTSAVYAEVPASQQAAKDGEKSKGKADPPLLGRTLATYGSTDHRSASLVLQVPTYPGVVATLTSPSAGFSPFHHRT